MVAEIIINSNVKGLNKKFDYEIPVELKDEVKLGSRVFVPFGRSGRLEDGFVINIKEKSEFNVKSITRVEQKIYLSDKKIKLAKWMSNMYFCNMADCIKLMLPPGTGNKNESKRVKEKNIDFVKILEVKDEFENIKTAKQQKIIEFLKQNEEIAVIDLENILNISRATIKTLEKKGYVEIFEKRIERDPLLNKKIEKNKKLKLNKEQEKAYSTIEEAIDDCMFSEFLLFGITGSGKTEVYLQLIEKVFMEQGKSSIMLVPEISLTPQTIDRFIARFGEENIAVLHSKLSNGERFDQWNKILSGQAKIIIGARSAIFAPIENLGLIIIDEEHDASYKSEMTPRYDTKVVAKELAKEFSVPIVYGSATPDIKTYYKAQNGQIELLELNQRANFAKLPQINVVDLRQELNNGNKSMISEKLKLEIEKNLKDKKQTILFLNRRGFSTFVMCRDCGNTIKCKNCNITMTYHLKNNKLKCHYCGYEKNNIYECEECKSKNIRYFGTGTQKLEVEINKLFRRSFSN